MKRSNSEILNKVRNAVSVKPEKESKTNTSISNHKENPFDNEIKKWINENAERLAREIIKEQVRKIFK